MLSVAKLALGQEAYYERQVAGGLDDYYAGRGESPGIWTGEGARELSLAGTVAGGSLGTLLHGVDPGSGGRLRVPVRERITTVRVLDLESGEWHEEERRLAPVSGYDLVFSCPKSVSLLHALTNDERVRRAISEAHEASWHAALGYLEREACVVRRGRGGAIRERGAGFVAAAFRHRTSRAQEPHLHTHVILANLARSPDGRYRALDGEAILRTYRLAAGYLYEAHLRYELGQSLGLRFAEPVKGMAEIEGVPEAALLAFSTRRRTLVEHMQARGVEGFAAARVAALATRERKKEVDLPTLRERWRARGAEHGLGTGELAELVGPPLHPHQPDGPALAERLLGPAGLTEKNTTFAMPELVRAVAGASPQGAGAVQVIAAADALSRRPELEEIARELAPGRPARFTTRELLRAERDALEIAIAGRGAGAPAAKRRLVDAVISAARPVLTAEQGSLVREACLSPDRVVCAVGVAGAGKTTALRALTRVFDRSGVPTLGAAPSGRAADELEASAGLRSSTLHRLLHDARRDGGLPRGCVLVVDEAGMAETRLLAPALRLVHAAGGKAVLVGDPAQLPSVGAGGLFAERVGACGLTNHSRQRDPGEREALASLRLGDAAPYLGQAARRGRLRLGEDERSAKAQLVEDWWQAAATDLRGAVMLAHRRADVRDLNEAAQARMAAAGRLGPEALFARGRAFRAGDRVVCRRNDRTLGVRNGTRGAIAGLRHGEGLLMLATDSGQRLSLPGKYVEDHLDLGYALTGHAAQGSTSERTFALIRSGGALREWGYVVCSRGRASTNLYAVAPEQPADLLGTGIPGTDSGVLLQSLERTSFEAAASDAREREGERADGRYRSLAR